MTRASKPRDTAALSLREWGSRVPVPSGLCTFDRISSDFKCPKDILRVFEEQGDRRGGRAHRGEVSPSFHQTTKGRATGSAEATSSKFASTRVLETRGNSGLCSGRFSFSPVPVSLSLAVSLSLSL